MNKFLFSKIGTLIPAGQSRADTMTQFKGYLETAGWVTLDSSTTDTDPYLVVRPPLSEAVGNARGYEAVRLNFRPNDILFRPMFVPTENVFRSYYITASYGWHQQQLQIGSTQFSVTGNGDPNASTQAIYDALVASSSPDALLYTYSLVTTWDGVKRIVARQAALGNNAPVPVDQGYMSVTKLTPEITANVPVDWGVYMADNFYRLPVDYGQSWVVYLGVTTRSIIMASRTMSGFYGPFAASYLNNSEARAQNNGETALAELALVGMNTGGEWKVRFQIHYGYAACRAISGQNLVAGDIVRVSGGNVAHPHAPLGVESHFVRGGYGEPQVRGFAGLIPPGNFPISDMFGGAKGATMMAVSFSSEITSRDLSHIYTYSNVWNPSGTLYDLNMYLINDSSETAHVVRNTEKSLLTAPLDASSTVMTLESTDAFPDQGTVIVESEVMTYTSKTTTTLNGLTRGVNGTLATAHTVTTPAYVGFWYLKINAGAVPTGYSPPGA